MERFYAPLCFRILNIENELQTKSYIQRDMLLLAIGVPTKERRGGKVEVGFGNFGGGGEEVRNYGGNGGRGCSIFRRGGGSLAICSMESKDGLGGEECLDGWVGVGGGEVKGSGVDFGVTKSLLGEIHGENAGESGGEEFRVDGAAI
ncbi:hypothetical protein Tco_0877102 [Tanacetum coccineum]|uniref:Uncharacterized protein n=1 Tax=Tanacetum coccineum TaxID=301880 RepID=A0ABQ5BU60_9ASTR